MIALSKIKVTSILKKYAWAFIYLGYILIVLYAAALLVNRSFSLFADLTAEDTRLYWTVGKGILNGYKPYQDLFSTQAPGVYYISALSFYLGGDAFIYHIIEALAILAVVFTPILIQINLSGKLSFVPVWISVVFGFLLGLYIERVGHGRVHTLSASLACLYLVVITLPKLKTNIKIILCTLCIFFAVGMMESYLLVFFAFVFMLNFSYFDALHYFLWPLALSIALGIFSLAALGLLSPYLTIYLPAMLGHRIYIYQNPWFTNMLIPVIHFLYEFNFFFYCLLSQYLFILSLII